MIFERPELYDCEPAERLLKKHLGQTYPRQIQFSGVTLELAKNVFAPDLTNTSVLMADCLEQYELKNTWRVLDLFTGSGLFAILAAKKGCRVLGVDKETNAIRCAQLNSALNHTTDLVEFRLGDALTCLHPDETFDLILACPPLLPGTPSSPLETALVDVGLTATLGVIESLPSRLTPRGLALIMISDVFQRLGHDLRSIARALNMNIKQVSAKTMPYETYSIHEFTRN